MTIKNLDRLLQKLDSLGGNSQKALKTGIHQATKLVQGDAKALCPVGDSGHLRNSIQVETEERDGNIVGKVSTNVYYAPYVEFGTGQRGEASPSPPKSDEDLNYLKKALKRFEDVPMRWKAAIQEKLEQEV